MLRLWMSHWEQWEWASTVKLWVGQWDNELKLAIKPRKAAGMYCTFIQILIIVTLLCRPWIVTSPGPCSLCFSSSFSTFNSPITEQKHHLYWAWQANQRAKTGSGQTKALRAYRNDSRWPWWACQHIHELLTGTAGPQVTACSWSRSN